MKKILFFIVFAAVSLIGNSQTVFKIDTIHAPTGADTFYHFPGYTDDIVGIHIDCRAMDDTSGASFNVGVGWAMYDTVFIQLKSDDLPATVSVTNDFQVAFEKIGMAFPYPKIKFTKGSSSDTLSYPIRYTYDR